MPPRITINNGPAKDQEVWLDTGYPHTRWIRCKNNYQHLYEYDTFMDGYVWAGKSRF